MVEYIVGADISLLRPAFALIKFDGKITIEKVTVVDNKGNSTKKNKKPIPQILYEIAEEFSEFIDPTFSFAKERSFSRFNKSTQQLFRTVGVIEETLWREVGTEFVEFSPTDIKKCIAGDGKASKEDVGEGIKKYIGDISFPGDDEADAIAAAITYLIKEKKICQL